MANIGFLNCITFCYELTRSFEYGGNPMAIFYKKSVVILGSYRNNVFSYSGSIVKSGIILFVKLNRRNVLYIFLLEIFFERLKINILPVILSCYSEKAELFNQVY